MINVTKPYLPNKAKFLEYVEQIYKTVWLTNNGPLYQELELRLKDYLGVRNIILVTNGTFALQIAYKALGLKGSVITSPFSFVATSSSIIWEGMEPIFADISPNDWNINPEEIERHIRADTSAIVPVHVFGNSCNVEAIETIAHKKKLKIVYDAAHAFGVNYKDASLLGYGDISTLSFHATKLFHTIEGGAIITSDDELAKKIRLMINFGITGPENIESLGINCKMNEFQAAMGLCILDEVDQIHKERKRIVEYYTSELENLVKFQSFDINCSRNNAYFPVLFNTEEQMKKVQVELNNNDIFPRRYFFPSLDTLEFNVCKQSMPVSNSIASRILCLPIYPELKDTIIAKITCIIKRNC